jgi:serine protease Do
MIVYGRQRTRESEEVTVPSIMSRVWVGAALAIATVAGATGMEAVREGHARTEGVPAAALPAAVAGPVGEESAAGDPNALSRAFRGATQRALPGVVYVEVEAARQAGRVPEQFRGLPGEDLFRRGEPQAPRRGSGSGFIFRPDGYVLTNNHVIDGAERVTVVMQDRREFSARVIGRDPNTDIAVLRIDATDLPVVPLGNSDPLEVGDWVVALGYPLQLGSTATAGILSAKGRSIGILRRSQEASAPLEHFLQTDAAINPGNSGGPLVDLEGRAVGINTAIASPTGYFSGYGFAVPINLARRVAEDLIRFGEVRRPRLGVGIKDVDPADAEVYGLPRPAGAAITQVTAGGAAERAGLRLGDVILAVEGRPLDSSGELMEQLARHAPGETVALDVVRFGQRLTVRARLESFEPAAPARRVEEPPPVDRLARLGFRVAESTPALRQRFRAEDGLIITDVDPAGPAARAGVTPGLVLERFNGTELGTVEELRRAAAGVEPGRAVSLVVRAGGERTIINFRVRG